MTLKQITKILIFFTIILNQSCENNDCEDTLCFTPPSPFIFELVDKSTGENLFTNGTYNSNDIEILNISDNTEIEYSFINENDINIIQIGSIGWESEIVECSLQINDTEILRLYVDAKRISENCCSFTRYDEFRIENAEYEYDNQSGIYRILLGQNNKDCITGELDSIISADQIIGQWKLIREKNPWGDANSYDYSNDNIVYNFQSNGNLVVTGNENNKGYYKNGEHNYVFEEDYLSNSYNPNKPKKWLVKIDSFEWTHKSQNNLMEIGQSYVDGNDYCFERIN